MERDCAPPEISKWSKQGHYRMCGPGNRIYYARAGIPSGQREISIKSVAHGIGIRASWEFKMVKMTSV
jgi:hypothetical protein